jgi:hypothetical protein
MYQQDAVGYRAAAPDQLPATDTRVRAVSSEDVGTKNRESAPLTTHEGWHAGCGSAHGLSSIRHILAQAAPVWRSGGSRRWLFSAASSSAMSDHPAPPIQVNRAPVLALWATVVAEALGHAPDTAITLGRYATSSSARIKAESIGIMDEAMEATERLAQAETLKPAVQFIVLLGREIPVLPARDGTPRTNEKGKPVAAAGVRSYIARAFGDRLDEVRVEMVTLAATLPPDELNRVGFRLYEKFRPEVPKGAEGWGAKGILHLDRIRSARRV